LIGPFFTAVTDGHDAVAKTALAQRRAGNKIRNGDILVPAWPGCLEKWPLNERRYMQN